MSIVAVRCLRCGGSGVPTGKPDQYKCENCGTLLPLVRPGDGTVISDSKIHHCPLCGIELKPHKSFKCTECGFVDFCETCVSSVPNFGVVRFVCRACIDAKGWACQTCGAFGMFACVNCGRRSCQAHGEELFGVLHQSRDEETVNFYNCPACNGPLCVGCVVEKRGFFSKKYYCGKCGVQVYSES